MPAASNHRLTALVIAAGAIALGSPSIAGESKSTPSARGAACQKPEGGPREHADKDHKDRDRDRERVPLGIPTFPPIKFTDEQLKQAVEAVRSISPETGENLDKLLASDPEQARQAINKLGPRLRFMVWSKVMDPEGFEIKAAEQRLQLQAAEIAQRIKQLSGDPEQAQRLKKELKPVLEHHYEARVKVMEHELLSLERRLQRLREELANQRTTKDKIIEERMAYLLSDNVDGQKPPR